jgi:uncharacterized damage-inducible protein DinB
MDFDFLVDTYETERLKTLGTWAQFHDNDMAFRPEPRARTPHEHMVHQCLSEDGWMARMLDLTIDWPELPASETRLGFIGHYAEASRLRLAQLKTLPPSWFAERTTFFDVTRSRAWVLVRRVAHTAHHRGQLTTYLRLLGRRLYSTYGPTADTGGLPANGAGVVYLYSNVEALLKGEREGGRSPALPGAGSAPPTERPDIPLP